MKVVIRPQCLIGRIAFQSEYSFQYIAVGERKISILLIAIIMIVQIMKKESEILPLTCIFIVLLT